MDTIGFLDALGAGRISLDEDAAFDAAVSGLTSPESEKQALLARDLDAVNVALGGRLTMMMQIWAPKRGPQEEQESETPDDDVPDDDAPDDTMPGKDSSR